MAIQYAGGTNVNSTIAADTKALLITGIQTGLTTAGWTVISGGGTTDVKLQSVATADGNQIRVRVWDSGSNCVNIRMTNVAETVGQNGQVYLLPATSKTFRIIANRYQFCLLVPGSLDNRDFALCSAIYIPAHLVSAGVTTAAFITGSGVSDSDAGSTRGGLRKTFTLRGYAGAESCTFYSILNLVELEYVGSADTASRPGLLQLAAMRGSQIHNIGCFRWHDDSALMTEPLVAWGTTADAEAKLKGQLWDAILSSEAYPMDQTTTFDSHNWYSVTDSNNGYMPAVGDTLTADVSARGTLFLVVP